LKFQATSESSNPFLDFGLRIDTLRTYHLLTDTLSIRKHHNFVGKEAISSLVPGSWDPKLLAGNPMITKFDLCILCKSLPDLYTAITF
jgi:hypothetical protein